MTSSMMSSGPDNGRLSRKTSLVASRTTRSTRASRHTGGPQAVGELRRPGRSCECRGGLERAPSPPLELGTEPPSHPIAEVRSLNQWCCPNNTQSAPRAARVRMCSTFRPWSTSCQPTARTCSVSTRAAIPTEANGHSQPRSGPPGLLFVPVGASVSEAARHNCRGRWTMGAWAGGSSSPWGWQPLRRGRRTHRARRCRGYRRSGCRGIGEACRRRPPPTWEAKGAWKSLLGTVEPSTHALQDVLSLSNDR